MYNKDGDLMKTIISNIKNEIEIKKSKFITLIYHVTNEKDVETYIKEAKDNYPNATHYCYAYKLNDIKRFSDDKEPSRTAGMPILNVLDKNELDNILCIVIRYFGGIKLGAGGLIRAYTKSVTSTLLNGEYIKISKCLKIKLTFSYNDRKIIDDILKNEKIIEKLFDNNITYIFYTSLDNKNILTNIPNIKLEIKEDYN